MTGSTTDSTNDAATPEDGRDELPFRRPLGWLTALVLIAVAGGFLLLRDRDSADTTAVPTLPDAGEVSRPTGDPAPDFSVDLIGGGEFHLADHLENDGRPVVLNLWASWCGPCRAEMPDLDRASRAHPEIHFIGVAVEDDPAAAERFAAQIGVSYQLAIDESNRVGRRYPSLGLPATYFIAADGSIVRIVYGQMREAQIEELLATVF